MKQGTNFSMPVKFDGLNTEDVERIEFIFKKSRNINAEAFKQSGYPSEVRLADGVFYVPWSVEETYLLEGGQIFYMDTLIEFSNSTENPSTNIVKLRMGETLFSMDEVIDD